MRVALLERVRQPAYTGENRCLACTMVNTGLVALAVAVLSLAGAQILAVAAAAVGFAAIWLRGYVVPYTPRFAPRLVAASPIPGTAFEHSGNAATASGLADQAAEADRPSGDAVLSALLEAGVVVPEHAEGDDNCGDDAVGDDSAPALTLEPAFREDWRREMEALREHDTAGLAAVADELTAPAVDVGVAAGWGRGTKTLRLTRDGTVSLERAVAIAELGAARALESRFEDRATRVAAGRPLRSLLAACPLCDGPLTVSRASCCGEVTPIGSTPTEKLYCPDCDVRVFTFE